MYRKDSIKDSFMLRTTRLESILFGPELLSSRFFTSSSNSLLYYFKEFLDLSPCSHTYTYIVHRLLYCVALDLVYDLSFENLMSVCRLSPLQFLDSYSVLWFWKSACNVRKLEWMEVHLHSASHFFMLKPQA